MVLRDHEGTIILSSSRHLISCNDIFEAELLAIKEGLSLALQWGILPIDLESDCLEAVMMIKGGATNKSKYAFIIRDIVSSLGQRDSCVAHTRQNCNIVRPCLVHKS